MAEVSVQQAFDFAIQHHQAGRLNEAENLYRQILAVQPDHAGALHYLGVIAHQIGRDDVAIEFIQQAIRLDPASADTHCNLGEAYRTSGRLDEAIAEYQHALALRPNYPEVQNNWGLALATQGQLEPALAAYHRALELQPDFAAAHYNLGNALKAQSQLEEAERAFLRAIELHPAFPEAHNNLGALLAQQGRDEEAIAAYRSALAIKPDHVEARNNLGDALRSCGQLDEALAEYNRALGLDPRKAYIHTNIGNVWKEKGQVGRAIEAYRRSFQLKPGAGVQSNVIYTLLFSAEPAPEAIAREQQEWHRHFAAPVASAIRPHPNNRDPERRLRIGYVSADFRAHVVGRNLLPLFHSHDHDHFEVIGYSSVPRPDRLTAEFAQYADRWRDVTLESDEALAGIIRSDSVDILVDLTQHMAGNRLAVFARRPAPVQVSFAGYPASAGVEAIEYRLSDRWLEEDAGAHTSEHVFFIDSFWCYDSCGIDVPVNDLPARENSGITFGSLNNFCKINDAVLRLWARVLVQVQNSRLLILAGLGDHRQRTIDFLGQHGVEAHRIEFIAPCPHDAYLQQYHRLDIVLDPFPYGGHTTSLDALWMGVPVVSLAGGTSVSRAGLSILNNLGLPDLVAFSEDDYVRIAVDLAGNLSRLTKLRTTSRGRMEASVLMNAPHFARQVEAAFRSMWRRWCTAPQDKK
jgi:predicted O-linked N-acetylglucosamine transferase (SPINDLY family)